MSFKLVNAYVKNLKILMYLIKLKVDFLTKVFNEFPLHQSEYAPFVKPQRTNCFQRLD